MAVLFTLPLKGSFFACQLLLIIAFGASSAESANVAAKENLSFLDDNKGSDHGKRRELSQCIGVPANNTDSIELFEFQLLKADPDKVRRLAQGGELCSEHGFYCGKLTEQRANNVATSYLDRRVSFRRIAAWAGSLILGLAALAALAINVLNRYRPRI